MMDDYQTSNPNINRHYTFPNWILYFTHLSLLSVIGWTSVEVIKSLFDKKWNTKYLSLIAVTWISTTGIFFFLPWIFLVTRDIAIIISDFEMRGWNSEMRFSPEAYAISEIIQSSILHVIVPSLSAHYFYRHCRTEVIMDKKEVVKTTFISFISLYMYYILIVISVLGIGIQAPYPFLDWVKYNQLWMIIGSIFIGIIVGVVFTLLNYSYVKQYNKGKIIEKKKKN